MRYLFHKLHVSIVFSQHKVEEPAIAAHHAKEDADIMDLKNIRGHTGLKAYIDGDLAKDIATRRSVTRVVHEYNQVVFARKIAK